MSKLLWEELNSKNQREYNKSRLILKKSIITGIKDLNSVRTTDEIYSFLKLFIENCNFNRPISIENDSAVKQEGIKFLLQANYPDEFIEWHRKYGCNYFWIESTRIVSTKDVIDGYNDPYYNLLTKNNYLYITKDGGGNCYVYDMNLKVPKIKFVDHDTVLTSNDFVEEIYSEYFDFWYDKDKGKYHNGKSLDVHKIFNEDDKFIQNSDFINKYLNKKLKSTNIISFNKFIISKIKEGFTDILNRYDISMD